MIHTVRYRIVGEHEGERRTELIEPADIDCTGSWQLPPTSIFTAVLLYLPATELTYGLPAPGLIVLVQFDVAI